MARILIAEGDANVRRLLVEIVTGLGHEAEAWEATIVGARPRSPARAGTGESDVLLLDSDLPDALALAEELRARRPRLPIISMSFGESPPRALALGPRSSLRKPFEAEALEEVLDRAVAAAHGALRADRDQA